MTSANTIYASTSCAPLITALVDYVVENRMRFVSVNDERRAYGFITVFSSRIVEAKHPRYKVEYKTLIL